MNLCRVCLSTSVHKDIWELKTSKKEDSKRYSEILSFCLGIQVTKETKSTTKLCNKCFRKILAYYKFKTLALESDTYLKTLNLCCTLKQEDVVVEENEEQSNNLCDSIFTNNNNKESCNNDDLYEEALGIEIKHDDDIKDEAEIKVENDTKDGQSDDELLSVLKKIKEEDTSMINNIPLEGDSNGETAKKRGRQKKYKSETRSKKKICEECGMSVSDIKEHSIKHIPMQERKRIPCKVCDKTFSTYGARYRHNKVKHLGIKYRCEICGSEVSHLNAHMARFHRPEKLKAPCVLCDKRFLNQSLLEIHMLKHTKEKPFKCDQCQKRFRLKITMLDHIRQMHDKEKSHLCQFCSKSFFKKYHLQVHIRSHTKEKPYKCDRCKSAFSCITTLKKHIETHRTEKNFHCDHCDMRFNRSCYLRVHMVCHTKEKRYPCKYCGVKFGRSDHRKRHQYTAHEKHILPILPE